VDGTYIGKEGVGVFEFQVVDIFDSLFAFSGGDLARQEEDPIPAFRANGAGV